MNLNIIWVSRYISKQPKGNVWRLRARMKWIIHFYESRLSFSASPIKTEVALDQFSYFHTINDDLSENSSNKEASSIRKEIKQN